ncbi:hypothetical protein ACEPAH_1389 [Sanghuangporus vaninii]
MQFLDLFDDVLLKIAYECCAIDIFMLERSCRTLRDFFSQPNRPLWMHILGELDEFHAPDLPPHIILDSLSSDELKRLSMRAAIGHANWSKPSSSGPWITRKCIIKPKNKGGMLGDLKQDKHIREVMKIVPGGAGEEFLFILWSEGYLQCWDVKKNTAIWTYPQLGTFQNEAIRGYDAEFDAQHGLLFIVVMELSAEPQDWRSPWYMKTFWLNPETKRATVCRKTNQGFAWDVPSALAICGDVIVMIGNRGVAIASRVLKQCFRLTGVEIISDSVAVSDGCLFFVGREGRDEHYSLIALHAQQLFTQPRIRGASCSFQPENVGFSLTEELRYSRIKEPLLTVVGHLGSVRLVPCRMTWRGPPHHTTIFVIGKLNDAAFSPNRIHGKSEDTCFWLSLFRFSSPVGHNSSLPSTLTLQQSTSVSIPLSHPYCTEDVHALSHCGRGILASVNTLHKGTRYYAFSFERLLEGCDRKPFGPISFGRDHVAPGVVYYEKYSGALIFVSKDQQKLVIQYYD